METRQRCHGSQIWTGTHVAERASKLFDRVIVAIAKNDDKQPMFTQAERKRQIAAAVNGYPNVEVAAFKGLLVDFAEEKKAQAIIRGLRAVSDFEFEFQMAMMNFHLNPDIASLFMMPDEKYIHLNSTVVKDVVKNGGDISAFVPPCVNDALLSKYSV